MPAAERTLGQTELDVTGQAPTRPVSSPKCSAAAAMAIPSLPRLINSLLRQLGRMVGLVWRRR
ncbi:unnamed protein product [Spirodela intermedia]|uniref:Uncharacterized protein n=1 Tax=Spirodela intermedia TaxID=51605 RepID=A0A7I8KC93_SPIIN|nr:unnamed protein product [Spirodela intermedia]